MRRIAIVGNCGTGKSTLARQLAAKLELTHIELDALFHQQGWSPTPPAEFVVKLNEALDNADATTNGWTTCGNYGSTTEGVNQVRADTIVWLDMPRWLLMRRVIWRTIRRAVTRQELWNGNREPLTNFYKWDPQENVIRWAWVKFAHYRQLYTTAMTDGRWDHATVHRLRSPDQVAKFLATADDGERVAYADSARARQSSWSQSFHRRSSW